MGANQQDQPGVRQGPKLTLGDVLYQDRTIPQESETAWVALVRAISQRDAQALHALYERSHRPVYTLALRITGRPDAAEETTLQVFYDVWTSARTYQADAGTVLAWIMNQARTRALERARRGSVAPGADQPSAFEERARLLKEALQGLTPEEHEAIETTYFSESTHAIVAARSKLPAGAFRGWIRSGLAKLRQALAGKP